MMLGLGFGLLLYGIVMWIQESVYKARARKAMKFIEIGIKKYWENTYHDL